MNWLAQLSFTQALRWALLWPAFILCLAVTAALFGVLIGPSVLFLALWRVARR